MEALKIIAGISLGLLLLVLVIFMIQQNSGYNKATGGGYGPHPSPSPRPPDAVYWKCDPNVGDCVESSDPNDFVIRANCEDQCSKPEQEFWGCELIDGQLLTGKCVQYQSHAEGPYPSQQTCEKSVSCKVPQYFNCIPSQKRCVSSIHSGTYGPTNPPTNVQAYYDCKKACIPGTKTQSQFQPQSSWHASTYLDISGISGISGVSGISQGLGEAYISPESSLGTTVFASGTTGTTGMCTVSETGEYTDKSTCAAACCSKHGQFYCERAQKCCDPAQCQACIGAECRSTCSNCETCVGGKCQPKCDSSKCMQCDAKTGNCVSACDSKNCETCIGGKCVSSCDSLKCQKCDGSGKCISTCTESQCQTCDDSGHCVSSCSDCKACINGACQGTCDPKQCQKCSGGKCSYVCDTANCQHCDGAGHCVSMCTGCQKCNGSGKCINACDPNKCQKCDPNLQVCVNICASEQSIPCPDGSMCAEGTTECPGKWCLKEGIKCPSSGKCPDGSACQSAQCSMKDCGHCDAGTCVLDQNLCQNGYMCFCPSGEKYPSSKCARQLSNCPKNANYTNNPTMFVCPNETGDEYWHGWTPGSCPDGSAAIRCSTGSLGPGASACCGCCPSSLCL